MRLLLGTLAIVLIFGCVSTSDELVAAAMLSGDWDAVNEEIAQSEERLARRQECRPGFVPFCTTGTDGTTCTCMETERVTFPTRSERPRPWRNH